MKLTQNQIKKVIEIALSYIDQPYDSKKFDCVNFVRTVYQKIGIEIPLLKSCAPSDKLSISIKQIKNPPIGHPILLKDRDDPRKERAWTHVAIILTKGTCIHCSLFFGRKVTISSFDEIFEKYDVVANNKTT